MNSKKPFSTISYNTLPWLNKVLEKYISNGKFVFWAYVFHKGEDDEAGLKDHIHLYIEPNTTFNTLKFTEDCIEPCTTSNLPLRCMPCRSSDFGNWFMYTTHNEDYLKFKGLGERKFHYNSTCYTVSDLDYFRFLVRSIDSIDTSWYADMKDCIKLGMSFDEYFARGGVPIQQIKNYKLAYETLAYMTLRGEKNEKNEQT